MDFEGVSQGQGAALRAAHGGLLTVGRTNKETNMGQKKVAVRVDDME